MANAGAIAEMNRLANGWYKELIADAVATRVMGPRICFRSWALRC